MRSHLATFITNLIAVIESVDPNMGPCFRAERKWNSDDRLSDDGAVIQIITAGLFDSFEQFGRALRFWIIEPWIEPTPLTNGSYEYRGRIRLLGFFGYRDDESQAEALRNAANELLDKLTERATELETLATGMGDGYMGYLEAPPRLSGPPRSARLTDGPLGHAVTLELDYHEEVTR